MYCNCSGHTFIKILIVKIIKNFFIILIKNVKYYTFIIENKHVWHLIFFFLLLKP